MKQLIAVFLSYILIFTSVTPSLAQSGVGRAVQNVAKVGTVSTRTTSAMNQLSSALAKASAGTLAGQVALSRVAVPLRAGTTQLSLPPQTQLKSVWPQWAARVVPGNPLSIESTVDVLRGRARLESLSLAQKESFYLTGYPAAVVEGPLVPTQAQLMDAIDYYGQVIVSARLNYAGLIDSFNHAKDKAEAWAKMMGAVTNLGLLGTAKDAPRILEAAKKNLGQGLAQWSDIIVVRALLGVEGYAEIQQLADYRLSLTDGYGEPMMLPADWHEIKAYMDQAGIPLEIAPERIAEHTGIAMPETFQTLLSKYNPYNLIHCNPSVEVTKLWLELRAGKDEKFIQSRISQSIKPSDLSANSTPAIEEAVAPKTTTLNNSSNNFSEAENLNKAVNESGNLAQPISVTKKPSIDFMQRGLASNAMEAGFPVHWEGANKSFPITFKFDAAKTKKAFYERVNLQPDEYFVFDEDTRAIIIRKELSAAQKSTGAKPQERGFSGLFFKGNQATPMNLYKILFAREMAPVFSKVADEGSAMALLSKHRHDLKLLLPKSFQSENPLLKAFLEAKSEDAVSAATLQLLSNSGTVLALAKDIAKELEGVVIKNVNTPMEISVYTDDVGVWTHKLSGGAEGTLGTMGQASTSALGILGIQKGFLSNLPTSAGQFGPAWAPFIGAWQSKYGGRKVLAAGQLIGTGGHLAAATSLGLGALGVLNPLAAFGGMVGGIVVNGVAGAILKQVNPLVIKQRAPERITASAMVADANSFASIGGMYCYLFLPVVGGVTTALFGLPVGLGTLSAMFGVASAIPLTSNLLLRKSKIENVQTASAKQKSVFGEIAGNLKFGFQSPYLRKLFATTAGAHFMGLGFNSGPGTFFKSAIA